MMSTCDECEEKAEEVKMAKCGRERCYGCDDYVKWDKLVSAGCSNCHGYDATRICLDCSNKGDKFCRFCDNHFCSHCQIYSKRCEFSYSCDECNVYCCGEGWWSGQQCGEDSFNKCESCCRRVCLDCDRENNFIKCETCYKKVCFDCSEDIFHCGVCNFAYCSWCKDMIFCDSFFCNECRDVRYCDNCDESSCAKCNKVFYCDVFEKDTCIDCDDMETGKVDDSHSNAKSDNNTSK